MASVEGDDLQLPQDYTQPHIDPRWYAGVVVPDLQDMPMGSVSTPNPLGSPNPFLLCLVNPGSGGQAGAKILAHLQKTLPADVGMASSLVARGGEIRYDGLWFQWHIFDDLAQRDFERPLHVCVFGGDGTVVWVCNALKYHEGIAARHPVVAVQPLGTGNDMARSLRWGKGLVEVPDYRELLHEIAESKEVHMDRWTVTVSPKPHGM